MGSFSEQPRRLTPGFDYVSKPPALYLITKVEGLSDPMDYPYPLFTTHHKYNDEYYTWCGPSFHVPGQNFPGCGAGEYKAAVSRLIALRKPDKIGYCQRLTYNQSKVVRLFRSYFHHFHIFIYTNLNERIYEDAYLDWVNQPHVKQQLRQDVDFKHKRYMDSHKDLNKPVQAKLKAGEIHTMDGKSRLIGDLGVNNTQITAAHVDYYKRAMEYPYIVGGYESRFIAHPSHDLLSSTFNWLRDVPIGHCHFAYFSDDCSFSLGCSDGVLLANGDISQCDGSHRNQLFDIVEKIMRFTPNGDHSLAYDSIGYAFSLLGKPVEIHNKHNYSEYVRYTFNQKRLYSGSTLTTIINNFANLLIFFSLHKRVPDPSQFTKAQMADEYRLAAERVGYIVKCAICERYEDLQLLKHSPCLGDDGVYHPIMNLGTFMKSRGRCYRDLSHVYGNSKVPLIERFKRYTKDVTVGQIPWGNHSINDAFRRSAGVTLDSSVMDLALRENLILRSTGGYPTPFFSLDALSVRYRCTINDLQELCDHIAASDIGIIINLPVCHFIYSKDYG